jgi:prepilin-type N-terminal cleavage/methylation domain-containing protein
MNTFSIRKGFTLIEILTVIGILAVIGTICVSIVTITFRTAKKTDLLNFARQNGDTALSQMVRNIRYASPTTCAASTTSTSVTITSIADKGVTTYSCASGTVASNGASLIDTNSLQAPAASCSFTCSQPSTAVPPIITIQFTLSPKTAGNFAETTFSMPFQSSVTLRNN